MTHGMLPSPWAAVCSCNQPDCPECAVPFDGPPCPVCDSPIEDGSRFCSLRCAVHQAVYQGDADSTIRRLLAERSEWAESFAVLVFGEPAVHRVRKAMEREDAEVLSAFDDPDTGRAA